MDNRDGGPRAPRPDLGRHGDGTAVVGAVGEGLLEVGLDPSLADDCLGRGFGGDAANVAVMAARLGARARLLTRVGDDAAGRMLMGFWTAVGIDLSAVGVDPVAPTGLYVNERDELGAHRFSYHRTGSAASLLGRRHAARRFLRGLDVLHVTGISLSISPSAAEAAETAAERARAAGVAISFAVNYREQLNPDRARLTAFARAADILFLSVEDARGLLEVERIEDVARVLAPAPPEIVMTHGPGPATLLVGRELHTLAPPVVTVVDTAGAGDALSGAYLATRFGGADSRTALRRGVVAAALSCEGAGCARSYPDRLAVDNALHGLGDGDRVALA
jgi:2-dehydro-3-deoxygluconokinase